MKKLVYLFAIAMLLFAGCAKDEMFNEDMNNPELKKAKVPIPMKVDICATPNWESDWIGYDPDVTTDDMPSIMIPGGTGTHIGKLNSEKSYWEVLVYVPRVDSEGTIYLFQSGTGHWVAANGDIIDYIWRVDAALPNLDCVGVIEFQSGTGKFEGCSGTLDFIGTVDAETVTICYTGKRFMEFN